MWWNDSHMPEYLLNNHEAYIGESLPKVGAEIVSILGYIAASALFMGGFMMYYYNMAYIPNFTFTKVAQTDFYNNAQRMITEKVGLQKDFMGSGK